MYHTKGFIIRKLPAQVMIKLARSLIRWNGQMKFKIYFNLVRVSKAVYTVEEFVASWWDNWNGPRKTRTWCQVWMNEQNLKTICTKNNKLFYL